MQGVRWQKMDGATLSAHSMRAGEDAKLRWDSGFLLAALLLMGGSYLLM